jgi:hypothetical protein
MRPATVALVLLGLTAGTACSGGSTAAIRVARSTSPPPAAPGSYSPAYGLVNDTKVTLSVTGCGKGCPRRALRPGEELDFSLGFGLVTVRRPDGRTTCLHVMNGIIPATPEPRQVLRVSRNTGAC